MTDRPESLALALVQTQRTLVLSTAAPEAWAAPVYYLYRDGKFYFFSSADSRHVGAALASGRCAGAIFRDSDDWREIEGLQMEGALERIDPGPEGVRVFEAYVGKFPTVKGFFDEDDEVDLGRFLERFGTRLYAFVPTRTFYLNNRSGLGSRREIRLPSS